MQCLSAPTRKELDQAHARQSYLDIGVLSPRNLKYISKNRRVRWLILGLSTIPLHLFYNSVIFASSGTKLYYPFLIKESFLTGNPAFDNFTSAVFVYPPNINESFYEVSLGESPDFKAHTYTSSSETEARRMKDLYSQDRLERLETPDCLKAYVTQFQTRGNVLLVSKRTDLEDPDIVSTLGGPWYSQDWVCGSDKCDENSPLAKQLWAQPETWSYIAVLAFTAWLLRLGTSVATADNATGAELIISLGFGQVNNRTTLHLPLTQLVTNAIIANTPQVILSWIYFSYNGLLTLMSLAREWESYGLHHKGLRVSVAPEGAQRSTYFLQLPYRIAIPFSMLSAFLHWLVSQSFFMVSVQLYGYDETQGWMFMPDNPGTRVSVGYSLLPLLVLLGTGAVMLIAISARGLMLLKSTTPIVGSCSAAIAAACQPLGEDDGDASAEKVKWGVMGRKQKFRHCGVSRRAVGALVPGKEYR
ncbi:hypothetical protein SLS60_009968 [Paraconiothyrium brasiliense]|uniref:DUF6536 domain-containing protein n=1 Tax=Paraconiothyrium brasiliense TaxID=300254 RepID=A0ABR3QTE6_9PLEO